MSLSDDEDDDITSEHDANNEVSSSTSSKVPTTSSSETVEDSSPRNPTESGFNFANDKRRLAEHQQRQLLKIDLNQLSGHGPYHTSNNKTRGSRHISEKTDFSELFRLVKQQRLQTSGDTIAVTSAAVTSNSYNVVSAVNSISTNSISAVNSISVNSISAVNSIGAVNSISDSTSMREEVSGEDDCRQQEVPLVVETAAPHADRRTTSTDYTAGMC